MRRLWQLCYLFALLGIAINPRPTWALQPNEIKITQPPAGFALTHQDSLPVQIQFGSGIDPGSIHLMVDNALLFPAPFPAYEGPDTRGFVIVSLTGFAFGTHLLGAIASTRAGLSVLDGILFTVVPTADEVTATFAATLEVLREGEAAGAFGHVGAALIRESLIAAQGSGGRAQCARLRCAFRFAHCESLSGRPNAARIGLALEKGISLLQGIVGCS